MAHCKLHSPGTFSPINSLETLQHSDAESKTVDQALPHGAWELGAVQNSRAPTAIVWHKTLS